MINLTFSASMIHLMDPLDTSECISYRIFKQIFESIYAIIQTDRSYNKAIF